ncbi:MAG TPA: lysophospholipid acyltransferase family protein [Candidatus Binataceae bacterium]|nr:lysophospholipid acyltransferase family protein [Candidatus Binataceae bacterium]
MPTVEESAGAPGAQPGERESARGAGVSRNGAARTAAGATPRNRRAQPLVLDWKSRAIFLVMVAALHAASLLPDFILYPIGIAGGWLGWVLDRRHVRIGMRNLEVAFPERSEAERSRILRASYINLGRSGAEFVRLGGFFYRRLGKRVSYHRYSYWKELGDRYPGKGMLILTAHFGNFELLAPAHALQGHPISLVHHTQRFLAGDALVSFVRERTGVEIIRKHAAARAVLRALASGGVVGIPFDQNAKRSEAIFVPFFGEPAATASGLARLAMISGAPILPVFLVREPDMRSHRIDIGDEVPVQRSGDLKADLVENTRRCVKVVEDIVRRYPEQFLWTHRRFRTRPRGMAPIYDWEVRSRRTSDRRPAPPPAP